MTDRAAKQAGYVRANVARKEAAGLKRVSVWVPREKIGELKRLAKEMLVAGGAGPKPEK